MVPTPLQAVTFDCWATLMYEAPAPPGPSGRIRLLAELTGTDVQRAGTAFARAWRQHQIEWHKNVVFAGPHMLELTLTELEIDLSPARFAELLHALQAEVLKHEVRAPAGTRALLLALQRAGIRRALICDTGFSPG